MPVPNPIPTSRSRLGKGLARLGILVALSLLLPLPVAFARGTEPSLRIPLENFGFQPLPAQFLLNGSSMLTLHYVDDKHLLLTFVVHRLIPRVPDDPEDDQDRVVDAVLLELPTGKILARTSWHLHDHAQYLWNLGHGHFLLRIRDTLTTVAPLANLSTGEPFAQQPFLVSPERRFSALIVSPEADLLIIESVKRLPPVKPPKTPIFGPTPPPAPALTEKNPVQINFYRIQSGDDGGPVQRSFAGVVQARNTGDIPATTAGYLAVVDQGRPHWAFDFHSYAGKVDELSPFDSSCSPAPLFVSHSEFIAFGCRNAQTMQQIGGFNMRGEEMWEQGLFGDYIAPSIAFAPAGGRFALSRILLHGSAIADQPISADEVSSQTVVVYQTGTGKQLLHADCSPIERAGQNFALSPNGLALAVIHADAIEIYTLPALTTKDESDVKLAHSIAPPENNLPSTSVARNLLQPRTLTPPRSPIRNPHPSQQPIPSRNPRNHLQLPHRRPPLSPPATPNLSSTAPHPPSTPCPTTKLPPTPRPRLNRKGPATVSRNQPYLN